MACRLPTSPRAHGTPLYVYSAATIADRYRAVDEAFASYPHAMHYALKANSTLAIARLLRGLGSGADANSGGEIDVALRAGFIPPQIVFTGVGKTAAELEQAIELGVKTINAESEGELERIDAIAGARQTRVRVALRINPDIDARSHPHISTGLKTNKFGIALRRGPRHLPSRRGATGLEIVGLHIHVGSQIMDLEPLSARRRPWSSSRASCAATALRIEHLDLGGGLGISYDGSSVRPRRTTRRRCCRSSKTAVPDHPRARAQHRRARRGAGRVGGRREGISRMENCS